MLETSSKGAEIVCRQLGLTGGRYFRHSISGGTDTMPVWLDSVWCRDTDASITECYHQPWGQTDCRHNEDILIRCDPDLNATENADETSDVPGKCFLSDNAIY